MSTERISDRGDFHSILDTILSRKQIAKLYVRAGWHARRCTWVDYEITCDWADLVIESESPILMNGLVDDLLVHVDELVSPLRAAGVSFKAECLSVQ